MSQNPRVALLLPTYNGARFLEAQLDSLFAQSFQDFIIIARDDGSTDDTRNILQAYQSRFPDRIHLVTDSGRNLGASSNFFLLIQYTLDQADSLGLMDAYLMLCDQDDIWEPHKIELELAAMEKLAQQNPLSPLLVHSDLTVINDDYSLIAESFLRYQGLDASRNDLRNMTFSNTVTGCTALFNQQLARKALPVPESAIMHDWWLAMVAAAFGSIQFIHEPLVRYRQHDQNTLGASEYIPRKFFARTTLRQLFRRNPDAMLKAVAAQAQEFLARYGAELTLMERIRLRLAGWLQSDSFFIQRVLFRLLRF